MQQKFVSRLSNYISTKQNFVRASVVCLGGPVAAIGAFLGRDFGVLAPAFIVILALIASYFWGVIMWRLMFRDIYARRQVPNPEDPKA